MARDITQLHPELQEKIKLLKGKCEKQGLKIGISECLRTVSEQDALYAKGRTTSGSIVTNAKGSTYSSCHQWGIAVDFYRNDGKGAYYDKDGFFSKVGKIGVSIGLEWGGNWKSIKDNPHFQLPQWGSSTSKLKKLYGTPEKFKATWNKSTTKSTTSEIKSDTVFKKINKDSSKDDVKKLQTALNKNGAKLTVDGKYGQNTKLAVLSYWKKLNWNKDGSSDGWTAGEKTLIKLGLIKN